MLSCMDTSRIKLLLHTITSSLHYLLFIIIKIQTIITVIISSCCLPDIPHYAHNRRNSVKFSPMVASVIQILQWLTNMQVPWLQCQSDLVHVNRNRHRRRFSFRGTTILIYPVYSFFNKKLDGCHGLL